MVEYPKKQNFPASVYNAAFNLVEFATSQFEDNTKQIESLIRQRELNISLGGKLKELLKKVENSLKLVLDGIDNMVSEDFLTIDLMAAYENLGLIIGEEIEDDLANRIFSKFCMGK